jgi:hypothetical protein
MSLLSPAIRFNRAKCLQCGDIVESAQLHDSKVCTCGGLTVSGGREYLRRSVKDPDLVEELSEYEPLMMAEVERRIAVALDEIKDAAASDSDSFIVKLKRQSVAEAEAWLERQYMAQAEALLALESSGKEG